MMADVLTREERAAIAAFPAERVQHIARGVSSEPTFMYDPLAHGQLRSSKPAGWRETIARETNAAKRARHNAKRRAIMRQRRMLVAELQATGRTLDQIAAHIGVSAETIKSDLRAVREAHHA